MHPFAVAFVAAILGLAGAAAVRKLAEALHSNNIDKVISQERVTSVSGAQQDCLDFLLVYLPKRDRGHITDQQLLEHVQLALRARVANKWAAAVPWDVFQEYVVPYRNVDEPLDNWRAMFYKRFAPMVANATSLAEAAQILNRDIWRIWGIHFLPDQTPEIMSVTQVLAAGYASCTGLSIFLVNACRAVGIPARIAGTPSWVQDRRGPNDRFNNHCWVEVWDGSSWSFTGACEYDAAGLNRTWFFPHPAKGQMPGSYWNAIYAASYKQTGVVFPLAWSPDDKGVPGLDVTQAYLRTSMPRSTAQV
eukprot:GHRR01002883.1.p1 GENE.GHRR01002883.1~~GHRR01002883.1.p1  ORF type:complete len:305 (+),score=65.54 GHRR01002883.1:356-1270(+)